MRVVLYMLIAYWLLSALFGVIEEGSPVRFYFYTMKTCQRLGVLFGEWGLQAESAYYLAQGQGQR